MEDLPSWCKDNMFNVSKKSLFHNDFRKSTTNHILFLTTFSPAIWEMLIISSYWLLLRLNSSHTQPHMFCIRLYITAFTCSLHNLCTGGPKLYKCNFIHRLVVHVQMTKKMWNYFLVLHWNPFLGCCVHWRENVRSSYNI